MALDGTKVKTNASKHKAQPTASAKQLSHERMLKAEKQLAQEINALMRKAEILDAQEGRRHADAQEPKEFHRPRQPSDENRWQ